MKYKQVIVIRKDLKMGPGKMVSQGSHASLCAFLNSDNKIRDLWLKDGAKKIVR
jgi:PTH2 family peptidyl-tRNA hydrolase